MGQSYFGPFLINCLGHIMNVSTLLRLSDHNVVVITTSIKPLTHKQIERSILLNKKANWNAMRAGLQPLMDEMCIKSTSVSYLDVNSMWKQFQDFVIYLIAKHIPQKVCRSRYSLPWIMASLRKQIKKRDIFMSE